MGRNGQRGLEILYQHAQQRTTENQETIREQNKKIAELESRLAQLALSQPVQKKPTEFADRVAIYGDNARVLQMDVKVFQQNISTGRNRFGDEDVSHVRRSDMYKVFESVAPRTPIAIDPPAKKRRSAVDESARLNELCQQLITHAAMLIYSDVNHPENITCYLPKQTGSNAMVHGEHGWTLEPVNIVFPPMVQKSINLIFDQQPIPGADGCPLEDVYGDFGVRPSAVFAQILRHLQANEQPLAQGAAENMRPVLIRNSDLLQRVRSAVEKGVPGNIPKMDISLLANNGALTGEAEEEESCPKLGTLMLNS